MAAVYEAIDLAQLECSAHLAVKIHNMKFDPKSAWEHMHILVGDDTSHHTSLPTMNMRLPDGTLATSDERNGSIFVSHLDDLSNNNRNVDWNVLENLKRRRVIKELDNQLEWCEF